MNLIDWPVGDPRWTDSGEGGLYAYLVVPAYEEVSRSTGGCCVCTYTYLTRPDVCVSPEEDANRVWQPAPEFGEGSSEHLHNARQKLEAAGHKKAAHNLTGLLGHDQLSRELDVSIFLGATDQALHDPATDDDGRVYFHATWEHLNFSGRALHALLKREHVHEPIILTFLDT